MLKTLLQSTVVQRLQHLGVGRVGGGGGGEGGGGGGGGGGGYLTHASLHYQSLLF